jgi:hypothetical protein
MIEADTARRAHNWQEVTVPVSGQTETLVTMRNCFSDDLHYPQNITQTAGLDKTDRGYVHYRHSPCPEESFFCGQGKSNGRWPFHNPRIRAPQSATAAR